MIVSKKRRLFNTLIVELFSVSLIFFNNITLSHAAQHNTSAKAGIIYQNEAPLPPYKTAPGQVIHISSGTGFFVSNDSIITNEHVVQDCKSIRIRGAVEPGFATLAYVDKKNDLALLKTSRSPIMAAPLRGDMPIAVGEEVSVMGYPLEHGMKGSYLIRKAKITNSDDVFDGVDRIQFTDSVEKGNSGGPLLDTNGTVIGVIVGKMNFYLAGADPKTTAPLKTSSVAITLDTLKHFLDKNHIFYRTDNTLYKFEDSYMENKAKDYIVNIQCAKDEQAVTNDASSETPNPRPSN